jgi:hypothetical protein
VITRLAHPGDLPGFLRLAGEVEQWFGPMVDDDGFRTAVMRNIGRGTSLVVDAHQGPELLGGLLFGGASRSIRSAGLSWLNKHVGRVSDGR